MISETIVVAILALIGSVFGSYMSANKTTSILQTRLDYLEQQLNKHNQLVERTYKLEKDMATAFLRIDELKDHIK